MALLIWRLAVEDPDRWARTAVEYAQLREAYGCTGARYLTSHADPREGIAILEFPSISEAYGYVHAVAQTQGLHRANVAALRVEFYEDLAMPTVAAVPAASDPPDVHVADTR